MFLQKVRDHQLAGGDLRRHPRQTVFKSALLYPVVRDANFSIKEVSKNGLRGDCALALSLRDEVHVSFDKEKFITAEVRWTKGSTCGLMVEEPLFFFGGVEENSGDIAIVGQPREPRISANLSATIVKSAPVLVGTVRNMSLEGMMIEPSGLDEGTRLLVKTRGDVRMGRVQWSSGEMAGVFFDREMNI